MRMELSEDGRSLYLEEVRVDLGTVLNEEILEQMNATLRTKYRFLAGRGCFLLPAGDLTRLGFYCLPLRKLELHKRVGGRSLYQQLVDVITEHLGVQNPTGSIKQADGSTYTVDADGRIWYSPRASHPSDAPI